jgi:Fe-S-cluster-containing hydrogenase component 2
MTATVRITDACTACGACLATCPERALRRAPRKPLVLDERCTACWDCVGICPTGAIVEAGPVEAGPVEFGLVEVGG